MPAGVPVGTLAIGRAGRGQRRAAGGGHPGHEAPALPRGGRALPRPADERGARRPGPSPTPAPPVARRVREGRRPRRRPARPDAGARRRSAGLRFRFLDPVPGGAGRPRGRAGRRRATTTRRRWTASRTGSTLVTYEFENVPVGSAQRGSPTRVPGASSAAGARGRAGPAGREDASSSRLGIAVPPLASRGERAPSSSRAVARAGPARGAEDAAARLRRQGTAVMRGARRRRAGVGAARAARR